MEITCTGFLPFRPAGIFTYDHCAVSCELRKSIKYNDCVDHGWLPLHSVLSPEIMTVLIMAGFHCILSCLQK